MSRVGYDLTDKVVFITGGNGGIGAATAHTLLDRGARVAVADIDPTTPNRAGELHPTNAFGCVADVCDRASLEAASTDDGGDGGSRLPAHHAEATRGTTVADQGPHKRVPQVRRAATRRQEAFP